jgi:hypothetical protein
MNAGGRLRALSSWPALPMVPLTSIFLVLRFRGPADAGVGMRAGEG